MMIYPNKSFRRALKSVDANDLKTMGRDSRSFRHPKWTPTWAMLDKKVQLVVYNYLWNYVRSHSSGLTRPGMPFRELEKIATTVGRERSLKQSQEHSDPKQRRIMAEHIRTSENGIGSRATRLIYLAYRDRLTNVDIAEELEMSHMQVRQLLCRLNWLARKLFPASECATLHWTCGKGRGRTKRKPQQTLPPSEAPQSIREMGERYAAGASLAQIGRELGFVHQTVKLKLQKYQLYNPRKTPQRLSKEIWAEIAHWYKEGVPATALAKAFEVSRPGAIHFKMSVMRVHR